jgi:hypothetical protein
VHQAYVFVHLAGKERLLVLEALAVVVAVRMGLWLLPFQKLRVLVTEVGQRPIRSHRSNSLPIDRIAWAVRATSQYVPQATCLTQALSGQVLLARRGHPTRLRIGVAKKSQEGLGAHAWLECEGRIVLGDHGSLAVYTPFPSLD